ncbi:MAG TPA: lamin tail domain-containing protein, partial [Candidatus Paceibacterota bacterium]|nr:lamin tail domain-containing protein [Candidatus Paceibacterota bacterium]
MKVLSLTHLIFVLSILNCFSASEPLGPSSRRTPIAISEIMYKPAQRADLRNAEFIELYNSNPWPEDISGWRLSGDIDFTFPPTTSIGGRAFVV